MSELLRVVDRRGRIVVLHERRWIDHICDEHFEMHGHEVSVGRTLREPEFHTEDEVLPNREAYDKRGALPPPDKDDFVKVVVGYREADNGEIVGRVITAYATPGVKQGERLIWRKP
jgi:hypothetical protein